MAAAEEGDVAGDGEQGEGAEGPSEEHVALLVAQLLPINELVAKIVVVFVRLLFQMSCLMVAP